MTCIMTESPKNNEPSYEEYTPFFKLLPTDLSNMVDRKDITCNRKLASLEDLGRLLHRNLVSGSFEVSSDATFLHRMLNTHKIKWQSMSVNSMYRKCSQIFYGRNLFSLEYKRSLLDITISNMKDKTLLLLVIASFLSLIVGAYKMIKEHDKYAWIEGTSIFMAVVVIVLIGTANEYSQEGLFTKLDKKKSKYIVKVFDNYSLDTKDSTDLVVGDVIYLEPGDIIPADCIILTEDFIICDESLISGESEAVEKMLGGDPFLISGTYVTEGAAKAIIVCVGRHSVKGSIIQQMNVKDKKTPLEVKVDDLAHDLATKAFYIAIILLTCHALKIIFFGSPYSVGIIMALVVESISIIVMAVPEGLPMATTLALSFGTKRMLRDNNLVREISACETMNNTNYICTDKTGTLTYNEMSIEYIFAGDKIINLKNKLDFCDLVFDKENKFIISDKFERKNIKRENNKQNNNERKVEENSLYIANNDEKTEKNYNSENNQINIQNNNKIKDQYNKETREKNERYTFNDTTNRISHNKKHNRADTTFFDKITKLTSLDFSIKNMIINSSAFENSDGVYIGSKCESALLKIIKSQGIDYNNVRREYRVIRRKPFSSNHKYMSSMIEYNSKYVVFFKGAPENISTHCDRAIIGGKNVAFEKEGLDRFIQKCDLKCLRSMAFSYLELDHFDPEAVHMGRHKAVFLCAVGMEDPLRDGIKDKIVESKEAGINVVMLTGDKMALAEHLAVKLGILTPSFLCISGSSFRSKTDDEILIIMHRIRVIARASPSDKKRFVELLQSKGNIVAVTGDGTNDGPALKAANVGFGMGISGTDIAKEASSVILLDDNFSSLVKSISWGRCINNSVRKFIQFQLTTTITTVVISMLSSLFSKAGMSAFSPLKLLWINIIMDTFAALALSTDMPSPNLLKKRPEPPHTPIITSGMKYFIFFSCIYQFAVIGTLYYLRASTSFIFNTFVFLLLFNEINARSLDPYESAFSGLFKNTIFIFTNLFVAFLQVIIINYFGVVFKTKPLSLTEWLCSVGIASSIVLYFVVVRMLQRFKVEKELNDWRRSFKYLSMELQMINALKDIGNTFYEV